MKKVSILIKILFIISLFFVNIVNASGTSSTLEHTKKAIVTIDSRIAVSAYKDIGSWTGTGFVTDKENGFIVTNAHVIGRASIGTYFVTFHSGQQAEAKLIYYDSWQDYAILKVAKSDLPESVEQIVFSGEVPKLNQSVFVVGNTEAQGFSFHSGYLSDLYSIDGEMPQGSYIINLNITGGASGSPVLNEKNEAIGIIYGGGQTYAFALHSDYVQRSLESLKNNKVPNRNHIGIITELYSLNKAVRHRNFPQAEMDAYLKKFPDARNRVVIVKTIIPASPAEKLLKPGDIIWEINNIELGGNLTVFDKEMDNSKNTNIKLTIYREGKKIEQTIDLYNINNNKIEQLVNFGGAIFFEADDYCSSKSGVPLKALTIATVQSGSSFSAIPAYFTQDYKNLYRTHIYEIENHKLDNIKDLIKYMPDITKEKFITIRFRNYQPYYSSFGHSFISSHDDMIADIVLDSIDTKPYILKYNSISNEWSTEDIELRD
ncbi:MULTISPECIES: S1C family serine protease [unclassified Rickettsia]|uniref:S1C family serine protease n=1 Tax=unclassified Rickettsia TaxID=114295 RepID=UPI003132DD64